MKNPFQSLEAVAKEFDGASDRATAVVGGAFLDEILAELLREFFVPDSASDKKVFEGTGPLATFSAKIEIAYRLGLISAEEHKMIHGVRGIRNEFAHELNDASFVCVR